MIITTYITEKEQWRVTVNYNDEISRTEADDFYEEVSKRCYVNYTKKEGYYDTYASWLCKGRAEALEISIVISEILCGMIGKTQRLRDIAEGEKLWAECINNGADFAVIRKRLEDRILELEKSLMESLDCPLCGES